MSHEPKVNIIVFGETGAGKSSLLNMLDGGAQADVANCARGVTFSSTCYDKTISDSTFKVFDTVGLNEGSAGTVAAKDAIEGLYKLIRQLDDGVNLLVYVMRAPRVKATAQQNYQMFFEVFCNKRVPIVIVITGLEDEDKMDQWWDNNRMSFEEYKMTFGGFVCITATKGKLRGGKHLYEAEYRESKRKVERLIYEAYSRQPWKMPTNSWFATTAVRIYNIYANVLGFEPWLLASELYDALRLYANLPDREAMAEANKIERNYRSPQVQPNVIVFGESGAGKSSILNMLDGGMRAEVSMKAKGVTFENTCFRKWIRGTAFNIFDTVGLNEGKAGTVTARDAIERLYGLIRQLEDGVNLLVFVMRAPRIKAIAQSNYEMFFEVFCKKEVPIVIVITGLEEEVRMDQWWDDNKAVFDRYKMSFKGFACITAYQGKLKNGAHIYQSEYDESKGRVEKLIYDSYNQDPWKMAGKPWFAQTAVRVHNFCAKALGIGPLAGSELYRALKTYAGLSDREAMAEAFKIEQGVGKRITQGPVPNVIIFGETGAGKSSIVNALDGGKKAAVSSQGKGTTFNSACYEKTILGSTFKIFDTVGLNESSAGTVAAKDAIEGLYKLIRQLDNGVNLLVYVIRAPRITRTAQQNYELFFEIFCDKQVPIVIVITGLEDEERMDQWWDDNKGIFEEYQMSFSGFACITATKGKLRGGVHLYEAEYEASKQRVERLIYGWHNPVPWKIPSNWFSSTAFRMRNVCATVLGFEPVALARALYRALKSYGGMSDQEALAQANRIALNYRPGRRLM